MSTYGSIPYSGYGGTWISGNTSTANTDTVYITSEYRKEEDKKPEDNEQWLRKRVKEICDFAKFNS